jgi:hypothetical protein
MLHCVRCGLRRPVDRGHAGACPATSGLHFVGGVKNQFCLFEHDTDLERHVNAHKTAIAQGATLADLFATTSQTAASSP